MSSTARESLRIALINSADYGGGAESVARLLRDGLRIAGHETAMWVGRRRGRDDPEGTRAIPVTPAERRVARRYAQKGFFSLGLPASKRFCESQALAGFDLIHLHNLHGHYLSIQDVPRLAGRFPLVWTLHDCYAFTGGCAFPFDCPKWSSMCGECPQLGEYPIATAFDRTRRMHSIKRNAFRDLSVTVVTPSNHLGDAARRSGFFPADNLRVIPYGVDTELFHPGRVEARHSLGLDPDKRIVSLVAQGLDDPRKGMEHAVAALRRMDPKNQTILLIGGGDASPILDALSGYDVQSYGYVKDRTQLARCLAASDLFVFPSLAENFPCTVQEAMACGTAVLAFDIDGVNEQITSGRTGYLVPAGDTDALTRAAGQLLQDRSGLEGVGQAARRHAETHWTLEQFINRHERLYREILSASGSTSRGKAANEVLSPDV